MNGKINGCFSSVSARLRNDPPALRSLSEIMESHDRLSIEPRLSSDPLTALAAVMREHNLEIELYDYKGASCANILSKRHCIFSNVKSRSEKITPDEIKPEPSND